MGRTIAEERYDCAARGGVALFDFAATVVHQTALVVKLDVGLEEPVWFPKSIIQDNGDETWTVPENMAIDKGLV